MHYDLHLLLKYWKLYFHPQKCFILKISKNVPNYSFAVKDTGNNTSCLIEQVFSAKDFCI